MNRSIRLIRILALIATLAVPTARATQFIGGGEVVYTAARPLNAKEPVTYLGAASASTETTENGYLRFTGGTNTVSGLFKMGSSVRRYSRLIEIDLTGSDTSLDATEFQALAEGGDYTTDGPFREEVNVTGGARLTVTNGFTLQANAALRQTLSVDGSTFEVTDGHINLLPLSGAGDNSVTTVVAFADSTVNLPAGQILAGTQGFDWRGLCQVTASASTLSVKGLTFQPGSQATFDGCVFSGLAGGLTFAAGFAERIEPLFVFRNCTIPSSAVDLGRSAKNTVTPQAAHLVIDGGSAVFSATTLGSTDVSTDCHPGWLTVTNGANVTLQAAAANQHTVGYFATGRLDVVRASVRLPDYTDSTLRIGFGSYDVAYGEVNVGPDGSLDNGTMAMRLGCGSKGVGALNVRGGTVKAGSLMVGDAGTRAEPSAVRVESGLLDVSSASANGVVTLGGGANQHAALYLTGGVLATHNLTAAATDSYLEVNGGTIRPLRRATDNALVGSIATAVVGAGGLTLDVAYDGMYLTQAFADKTGEAGVVTKTGSGSFELRPTAWSVAKTVVAGGILSVTDASVADLETTLVVTNGASFSMVDSTARTLTLDGLQIDCGILRLDVGDRIVVDGTADIRNLTVVFSSKPATDDARIVIEATAFTEGSLNELRRALAKSVSETTSTYGHAGVSTSGGRTVVSMSVERVANPLDEDSNTVWQVGSTAGWNAPASWDKGVPARGSRAVFPAASDPQTVAVPDAAALTAVSIGGDSSLTGGPLAFQGRRGELEVEVAGGDSDFAAPLALDETTAVGVDAGASLTLSGSIDGGGLVKGGSGKLVLAAANDFVADLVVSGGLAVVRHPDALGKSGVTLRKDTLEIDADDESETVITGALNVTADGQYKSVVLKTETPTVLRNFSSVRGGFIKRGAAPLAIEIHDGDVLAKLPATLAPNNVQQFVDFTADGAAPDNTSLTRSDAQCFSALTVAEGEVVVRPAEGETLPTVDARADATCLSIKNTNGTVRARLVIDGVRYDAGAYAVYVNGFNSGNPYDAASKKITLVPELLKGELVITNGGQLALGKLSVNSFANNPNMVPTLALTNGTVEASGDIQFSYSSVAPSSLEPSSVARIRAKDSTLTTATKFYNMLRVDGEFDNCQLTGPTFEFESGSSGRLALRNGSIFSVGALSFANFRAKALKDETQKLVFDGAEWRYGTDADYTFDPVFPNGSADDFILELQGEGLTLAPTADTVFETRFPFVGEGGLVAAGDGTIRFAANTLQFTGTLDVASGTLDLSSETAVLTNRTLKGSGKIKGGRFSGLTLDAATSSLTFDGTAFIGRLLVDFGRTSENPIDPKVLSAGVILGFCEGDPLQLPRTVRAINTGNEPCRGTLRLEDGKIIGSFAKTGLSIVIR